MPRLKERRNVRKEKLADLTPEEKERNDYTNRRWYHRNRDKLLEYKIDWRKEHRDKILAYQHTYYAKHPKTYLLRSTKTSANKMGREHTITQDDVIIPELCPVFKIPMVQFTPFAPSLDRIDSSKGYIPGNVQVISRKANTMKNNATAEELRMFAEWVLS